MIGRAFVRNWYFFIYPSEYAHDLYRLEDAIGWAEDAEFLDLCRYSQLALDRLKQANSVIDCLAKKYGVDTEYKNIRVVVVELELAIRTAALQASKRKRA
jgi:hypothetical protein